MMSPEQLRRIHEAGLRVLARTGLVFRDQETVALFVYHGFTVDGLRVTMTREQVDACLVSVPGSFTLEARDPSRDLLFGGDGLVVTTGAGPALIVDEDIPAAEHYARCVQCALTLTDKPLEYALSTDEQVRIALDTSEILYGSASRRSGAGSARAARLPGGVWGLVVSGVDGVGRPPLRDT